MNRQELVKSAAGDPKKFQEIFFEFGEDLLNDDYVIDVIFRTPSFYDIISELSAEDYLFTQINQSKIYEITINIIKENNVNALDFILNNVDDLGFDINHIEKNRGFLEVAIFFNHPQMVRMLIESSIDITKRIARSIGSWMTDNSLFIKNQMHAKYKDEEWKGDFQSVILEISKVENRKLRETALKIKDENLETVYREIAKGVSSLGVDRIVEKLNKLDTETKREIIDILESGMPDSY